jgi:glutathione synthase/RimK-type ligase-like ATP-grasp enzyme
LENVGAVLYRRPQRFRLPEELSPGGRSFAERECLMGLGGLLRALPVHWLNHPDRIVAASYKPHQLSVAARAGLDIPRTLVTNDAQAVQDFFRDLDGRVIYKTLDTAIGYEARSEDSHAATFNAIYTSDVPAASILDSDSIRWAPCMFQEKLPKQVELRITAVGQRLFAAEIYAQQTDRGRTDWRLGYEQLTYGLHQLPAAVEESCLSLLGAFGLEFGAIDMIVTPDGRYVFLEINPGGQWLWIEYATGLAISGAIADNLAEAVRRHAASLDGQVEVQQ